MRTQATNFYAHARTQTERLINGQKEGWIDGWTDTCCNYLHQCFSTAGPQPGTGPRHQLDRATRGSPGICHFSFLSILHE